ncbi:MAG: glycosyltransferase family 2 protein [Pseudomarimonas sp.]
MISVVVLTLNEAANLPRCLASVAWADDILVLDSGTTDATCEIAKAAGARVQARAFDSFAGQRNYAMDHGQLRNGWVLHLDADEVVTTELRIELEQLVSRNTEEKPVWRVASRIIFMGRWLRRAGMYPSYQVRFGRADALRFVDFGHGQREVQPAEQVGTLSHPLDHYNFSKGVNDWLARHLRYAKAEAEELLRARQQPLRLTELLSGDPTLRRRALKRLSYYAPCRGLLAFLYAFVIRGGALDGRAGFTYCRMFAMYHSFIGLNAAERIARSSDQR